jgi:hypothetical protein
MPDQKLSPWMQKFSDWLDQDGTLQRLIKSKDPGMEPLLPEAKTLTGGHEPDTFAGGFTSGLYNEFIRPLSSMGGMASMIAPGESAAEAIPANMSKAEFATWLKANPGITDRLLNLVNDQAGELRLNVQGRLADLIRKGKGGYQFGAQSLKMMEDAIKRGDGLDKLWEPLKQHLDAFNGDPTAAQMFSRVWGSTSPNTPVGRNNYEAIQAWKKVLGNEVPFTKDNARAADITMVGAKVPNLNRAIESKPVQGTRGEVGKTENMSQLVYGDPSAIPIDVHALSGVGASEDAVHKTYAPLREKFAAGRGSANYTDLYNIAKEAYQHGLDKFGSNFPTMWEGVKLLKDQGQSAGLTTWLKKWGLLEPGAMVNEDALNHLISNIDRAEFYGRGLKNVEVAEAKPFVSVPAKRMSPEEVAHAYAEKKGLNPPLPHDPVKVNKAFAEQVAQAYDLIKHNPNDPAVKKAYGALANEISDQFEFITKEGGLKAEPWTKPGQPYADSKAMMEDVNTKNHLFYFPTEAGYGHAEGVTDHPLLQPGRSGLPLNDEFRIVHDYLAHAKGGFSFGPHGEENAFIEHSKLLSPEARKALATETRGQNSWVNFGPNAHLPVKERPFAEQKAGLLPEEMHEPYPFKERTPPPMKAPMPPERRMSDLLKKFGGLSETPEARDANPMNYGRRSTDTPIELEHRTPKQGLTEIDPAFYGTGQAGAEKARAGDKNFLNRSYFNVAGTPPEARFRGMPVYKGKIAGGEVYQLSDDPLGLVKKAQDLSQGDNSVARTLFELLVHNAGFKGYSDGKTVALFDKLSVTP